MIRPGLEAAPGADQTRSVLLLALSTFAVRMLATGAALLMQVVVARAAGVEQFGLYSCAMTWVNVSIVAACLGGDVLLVRFIAAYRSLERWDLVRGLLSRFVFWCLLASGMAGIGLCLVSPGPGGLSAGASRATFAVAGLLLPVMVIATLLQSALRGLRRIVVSDMPLTLLRPLVVVAIVLVVWRSGGSIGAPQAMGATLGGSVLALLVCSLLVFRTLPAAFHQSAAAHEGARWLAEGIPAALARVLRTLTMRLDLMILGMLRGPAEAGLFGVACRVSELLTFGQWAMGSVAAPLIPEYHVQADRPGLQRLLRLNARASTAFSLAAGLLIAVGHRQVLVLFGSEFLAAGDILLVLLAGRLCCSWTGTAGPLADMTGNQRASLAITGISTAVALVLLLTLIPRWGAMGAAVASSLTVAFDALALSAYLRRRLGVSTLPL